MRLNLFIKRWVDGVPFGECLIDPRGEELSYIKQYGHTIKTLEQAREIANRLDDETNDIKNEYIDTHEYVINENIGEMIDGVVVEIIKESLKKEIG